MEFRTPVVPDTRHRGLLDHAGRYLLLGSCFTGEMTLRLKADGFDAVANPGGALYNPLSVLAWVRRLARPVTFTEADLVEGPDGRLHSWMHHSAFSSAHPVRALELMNGALVGASQALAGARAVFITLGSTRVFRLAAGGAVVANCHKHHPSTFIESRLSLDETVGALRAAVAEIAGVNPAARVVFTVSPVRHPGQGGLHANAVSKATLLLAVEEVGEIYFPAYEALIDDLRDYRFTAADMRHPSATAADYIYELLAATFMTPDTLRRALDCRRSSRAAAHRPRD